jgi:hypothetical protein
MGELERHADRASPVLDAGGGHCGCAESGAPANPNGAAMSGPNTRGRSARNAPSPRAKTSGGGSALRARVASTTNGPTRNAVVVP